MFSQVIFLNVTAGVFMKLNDPHKVMSEFFKAIISFCQMFRNAFYPSMEIFILLELIVDV